MDAPVSKYSANADLAASLTSREGGKNGCEACIKSGLPVLLVRTGLADARYAQNKQSIIGPWLDNGTAPVALSYSRYAMRTLRQGYVMAYYENPHTPDLKVQKGWQAFRVDEGGYMTPHPLGELPASAASDAQTFTCQRTSSYATAMLFVIQDAKHTGKVWVGFSDHPFSEGVRERYAQHVALRSQRMSEINSLIGKCPRSQQISEALISQGIADYDPELPLSALRGNPHTSLGLTDQPGIAGKRPERARDLMLQAQALCDANGYSISDVNIACVPDAVGITHEAATLRSTLCNSSGKWLEQQPDGQWRLQTALSIEGLLREIDARGEARKAQLNQHTEYQGKPITKHAFDAAIKDGSLPPDVQFEADLIQHRYDLSTFYPDPHNGKVRLPSQRWVDSQSDSFKQDLLGKLEGGNGDYAYREFLNNFNKLVKEDQQRRQQLEPDYGAWLRSAARHCVTENDCDTHDRLDGLYYAHLVSLLTVGGPMTEQSVEWFADFLKEDPEDKNNLLIRALLGHQAEFFESFTAGKLLKEAKTLLKIFEEAATASQDGKPLTADQRIAQRFVAAPRIIEHMPTLKLALSGYGHGLILLTGATAAALDKNSKLGAGLRSSLIALMQAIVASTGPVGMTAQAVQMSLTDAQRWWRAQANALTQRTQQADKQVRSLAVGGALALDLIGAPKSSSKLVEVYLLARETLPKTLTQLVGQGGKAAEVMSRLVNDSAKVLRDGAAPLSAAAGVLNLLSLSKASQLYETGTEDERRKASFMLLSSGLGLTSVVLELSEAIAKQKGATVARQLKVVSGGLGVIGLAVDTAFSVITVFSRSQKNDLDSAISYGIQAAAFAGAAVASGFSVALGAKAVTAVGVGLSWTGWALILIAAGMTAGYVAAVLQDTPAAEWVARSIWGRASQQWGSIEREQQALNKILLGLSIEFDYSQSLIENLGTSASAADSSFALGYPGEGYFKEVRLSLLFPALLKEVLQWKVEIYLHCSNAEKILVYSAGNGAQLITHPSCYDGVDSPEISYVSDDLTLVTIKAQMNKYPGSSAIFNLYDGLAGSDVLVNENFSVR